MPFLSEVAVREYLSARFPAGAMVPGLSRLLHQRTDGNPLFLVNLVEYWLAEGWIAAEGSRLALGASLDELAVGVPENLWQMIECWIGRLDPGQQRVLEVSSVAGTEFSAAAVAAGLGQEVAEVDDCCAKLARQAKWLAATGETLWPDGTTAGGYRFVHALYQEALHRRVSPARRVWLHRLIGERQETAYGDRVNEIAAPLAVHFERGREYRKAIGYLRRAADVAVRRCANNEALDYLSKGLVLVDTLGSAPDRTRLELDFLTAAGPALTALKGYGAPEVERAYVRAAALCDRLKDEARLTAVLRGLVALRQQRGELRPALHLTRRLLGLARRAQDASRLLQAHQAAGTTLFYLGELRQARQRLLEQQEGKGAQDRAMQRTEPAEDHHHQQLGGALPRHVGRGDELRLVGEQHACDGAHRAGDDAGDQLVGKRREADRLHADRVLADAAQHPPEARGDDAAAHGIGADEHRQHHVVEADVARERLEAQ